MRRVALATARSSKLGREGMAFPEAVAAPFGNYPLNFNFNGRKIGEIARYGGDGTCGCCLEACERKTRVTAVFRMTESPVCGSPPKKSSAAKS